MNERDRWVWGSWKDHLTPLGKKYVNETGLPPPPYFVGELPPPPKEER